MKKSTGMYSIFLISLIMSFLIFSSCETKMSKKETDDPQKIGAEKETTIEELFDVSLFFMTKDQNGKYVFLDIHENPKKVSIQKAELPTDSDRLEPFVETTIVRPEASDSPIFFQTMKPIRFTGPTFFSENLESAARIAPTAALSEVLNSGLYRGCALLDYKIKKSDYKITSDYSAEITVVADISPAYGAYLYKEPDEEGVCSDIRFLFTIYGTDGKFFAYKLEDDALGKNIFFKEGSDLFPENYPQVEYKVKEAPNFFETLDNGGTVDTVCYEDENYSYFTRDRLIKKQEEKYFKANLMQINRTTGEEKMISPLPRNVTHLQNLYETNKLVYFSSISSIPYSEGYAGSLFEFDKETLKIKEILTGQVTSFALSDGMLYVAKIKSDDMSEGIYEIEPEKGTIERLGDLPGPSYSTAYEGSVTINVEDRIVHVIWPDYSAGTGYVTYEFDLRNGSSTVEEMK